MRVGNALIGAGILLVVAGVAARLGWLSWFGHLPGDIRTRGERVTVFFPVTSMIVVSVVATVAINLLDRIFRR